MKRPVLARHLATDHGRLKELDSCDARSESLRSAQTLAAGHVFVQYARRGDQEIATDEPAPDWLRTAFDALALCV
jgi:hypothetical protein